MPEGTHIKRWRPNFTAFICFSAWLLLAYMLSHRGRVTYDDVIPYDRVVN